MTFLTAARQQIAMQQVTCPRPEIFSPRPSLSRLGQQRFTETLVVRLATSVFALLVVPVVLDGKNFQGQTHVPQSIKLAQQQKDDAEQAQPRRPAPESTVVQPLVSPAPIWPANQPPNQARVSWDSRGLEIEAFNSSLNQILRQVAADTGTKVEGLTQDQHVFGSYGPGPGSEVLWKLLDGSGYNILMIGGRDTGAPLEIVLSAIPPASPKAAENNQNRLNPKGDEASEQRVPESQPASPPEPPNPFGNGAPPRDPQEFMQEILQRQQQIDQQQQQQGQQNNPQ